MLLPGLLGIVVLGARVVPDPELDAALPVPGLKLKLCDMLLQRRLHAASVILAVALVKHDAVEVENGLRLCLGDGFHGTTIVGPNEDGHVHAALIQEAEVLRPVVLPARVPEVQGCLLSLVNLSDRLVPQLGELLLRDLLASALAPFSLIFSSPLNLSSPAPASAMRASASR